jgi:hypothetical protein
MKLIFGMQSYSNPTRRYIEDDLNFFEKGRRPQFFLKMEDDLKKIMQPKPIQSKKKIF